jgi:hypothetical protein
MAPFWVYTEPGSGPFWLACILLPDPVMLFIAVNDSGSSFTQGLLPSGWLLTNVQVNITI